MLPVQDTAFSLITSKKTLCIMQVGQCLCGSHAPPTCSVGWQANINSGMTVLQQQVTQ